MADRASSLILEHSAYDLNHVVADINEIRRINPQRYEMEQLTAIVYEDPVKFITVGYKDLTPNEFWVRGHMPGTPLMPGVLMCEAAAQLCSYYAIKLDLIGTQMIGFGGLDEVRFRDLVFPGSRLVIVAELLKIRRNALVICRFQEFVDQVLVCEGQIRGVALPVDRLGERTNQKG